MPALSHSPADIVQKLLTEMGLGTDPDLSPIQAWPVYASNEPNEPDNCITVYDTQGHDSGRTNPDGEVLDHFGIMIRFRAVTHAVGALKAQNLKAVLAEQAYAQKITLDTARYLVPCFANIGQVLYNGLDNPNSKRSVFTLNMTSAIRVL